MIFRRLVLQFISLPTLVIAALTSCSNSGDNGQNKAITRLEVSYSMADVPVQGALEVLDRSISVYHRIALRSPSAESARPFRMSLPGHPARLPGGEEPSPTPQVNPEAKPTTKAELLAHHNTLPRLYDSFKISLDGTELSEEQFEVVSSGADAVLRLKTPLIGQHVLDMKYTIKRGYSFSMESQSFTSALVGGNSTPIEQASANFLLPSILPVSAVDVRVQLFDDPHQHRELPQVNEVVQVLRDTVESRGRIQVKTVKGLSAGLGFQVTLTWRNGVIHPGFAQDLVDGAYVDVLEDP